MGDLIDILLRRQRHRGPSLEKGRGLQPPPRLWFCPSPGTPDWRGLADPDTFARLASDCDVLQLYQDQLREFPLPASSPPREALPPEGWNTWRAFREWGILSMAASRDLPVAVECAGLKEWSVDPAVYADRILESVHTGRRIGGRVDAVALDEPWNAGLHLQEPSWSFARVLAHIIELQRRVREAEPGLEIGVIEPYPALPADTICSIVETLLPAFFHLDIDYRAARQRGSLATLQADVVRISHACRGAGVPFGVIIWGYEDETAETFVSSAKTLLAVLQQAVFRGDLPWPDRLIVQSWSSTAILGPRVIPPTLPPDSPASLWGLLRTVRAAL